MVTLSVNINKIAVLRNARGKNEPNLTEAVEKLMGWGVKSITVHPRPDGRHILYEDVREIKQLVSSKRVELNVEGYPSSDFLQLMEEVKPDQCTLVPDAPSVLTSNAGWKVEQNFNFLKPILESFKKQKIRSSLFIDPFTWTEKESQALKQLKPDRAELYTEAYAKAYAEKRQTPVVVEVYAKTAKQCAKNGIGINAGHDLNLDNLAYLLEKVPEIKEVSIGHALISEALYTGLETTVKKYLAICM